MCVGSDRVDTRKIPGMLRKHSFPGSQTEEEGNKSIHRVWKPIFQLSHTNNKVQPDIFPKKYKAM